MSFETQTPAIGDCAGSDNQELLVQRRRRTRSLGCRRGSLTVEFAFTAPIFFLFIFGCVEFARVHMIQAAIENAAFEGARRGIIPGATSANCEASTSTLLNYAGLQDATITVSPTVIDVTTEEVSVTVDVPMTVENGIGLTGYLTGKTLSRTITLPREQ